MEERAAKVAIEALWSGVQLEIDNVLKEVCDIVLDVNKITNIRCLDRIDALEKLGKVFEGVVPDVILEDFVHVEHRGT